MGSWGSYGKPVLGKTDGVGYVPQTSSKPWASSTHLLIVSDFFFFSVGQDLFQKFVLGISHSGITGPHGKQPRASCQGTGWGTGEASLSWWSQVTLDEVFPKQLTQLCEGLVDSRPCISYTFGEVMLCH